MRQYVIFSLAIAILLAAAALYAITITSRTIQVDGVTAGEVVVNDQVPIRLRFPAGGLTPGERAGLIAQRLSNIPNLVANDITVGSVGSQWVVLGRDQLLATADSAHAAANNTTPYNLAIGWKNQLRSAIGGDTMTPAPSDPTTPTADTPPTATPAPPVPPPPVAPVNAAQKVVPILSIGDGLRVGAALVVGSDEQVQKVKAVAQLEGDFKGVVRIRALVPVESEDVIKNIKRVPGTSVAGLADIKL